MRDHCHFFGKALYMVGFFFEEGQWNEQWKVAIFNASGFDFCIHQLLDAFPHAIAPGPNDHTATHARFFGQIGFRDDFLIPAREILSARNA